jgi:hypothetical protein
MEVFLLYFKWPIESVGKEEKDQFVDSGMICSDVLEFMIWERNCEMECEEHLLGESNVEAGNLSCSVGIVSRLQA